MTEQNKRLLQSAKEIAADSPTWADLSNALFDPINGLITRAYPSPDERAAFVKSDEYRQIRSLISAAMDKTGLVAGATPQKSGKFVVRLPKTLHAALDREAESEGVSLNQLVVTKLAVQMSKLASSPQSEMASIAQAYLEVRDCYSTDRVVADPELNRRFLRRCRELGLAGTDFDLNWKLFSARKNRALKDIPKTKIYTPSRKDEFEFSSEIAVRYIQDLVWREESKHVSLDRIICDPELAERFDEVAKKLAPGFTPLDYRWIALGVRKASGRHSTEAKKLEMPHFELLGNTKSVKASTIPKEQGLYFFQCEDRSLFVGETDNLRDRIERHFDVSEHFGLPNWLYDRRGNPLILGLLHTPKIRSTQRKTLEVCTVSHLHPIFNYIPGSEAA